MAACYDARVRRILVVLAASSVACGGLLGLGADDDPTVTDAAEASTDGKNTPPSQDGDTTIPVDELDGAADADGARADARDAKKEDPGCQGDAGCTRYVFVTSTTHLGTLLGLNGADAICNARKIANPVLANRKFVAWISTQTTNAKDRFAATAPIRRTDGVQIAASLADLLVNGPTQPIALDETGKLVVNDDAVFTGTQNDGVVNNNCEDWSAADAPAKIGSALASNAASWTDQGTLPCNQKARIYCFEY